MADKMTHSWTFEELWTVCVCYKEGLPEELALRLTNTTNAKSMAMRYQNCKYLESGPVEGALSHPSKKHVEAWQKVNELYTQVSPLPKAEVFISDFLAVVLAILIFVNAVKILGYTD